MPTLLSLPELLDAVDEEINPQSRSAAIIFNSHITGLAVARSLGRRGVPIIALDRDPKGYALVSKYVSMAALCPNVLTDEQGFIDFLLELGQTLMQPGILFPCNDEWVLAINRHRAELEPFFKFPFAGPEIVEPVLDKERLYRTASELEIPIPGTWYLNQQTPTEIANQLPYPCIVKPTEQRSFYDAFQAKVWQVEDATSFHAALEQAQGHSLVAQEIVGSGLTDFYSLCTYIGRDGEAHGTFVGRKLEQYPAQFGTGCLVASERVDEIAQRGVQILKTLHYQGIAEVEFIYDERTGEHKLLDINTRVWKWIGLPIAAGVDLPWLAYTDTLGQPEQAPEPQEGLVWTYAKDYIALRLEGHGKETASYLPESAWEELVSGHPKHVVDAVLDSDDPRPAARMLQNTFNPSPYFCAC
jgi:predicted ATP-grasp superfamily ATP-dependent carboligase